MEGMACHWIALIPLRCSGNQATILLEALVLMANPCRLDGWIHSIGLGGHERGGLASSFKAIYRSHNLLKRSNQKDQAYSDVESITWSPSLLPKPITANVAYYSQRTAPTLSHWIWLPRSHRSTIYSLHYVWSAACITLQSVTLHWTYHHCERLPLRRWPTKEEQLELQP